MESNLTHSEIGFIGLGIMGKPMALNLIKSGYHVNFYARKKSVINSMVKKGGENVKSISELANKCKIIFLNLTDDQAINEVICGKNNILSNINKHSIIIDMSTISPLTSINLAEKLAKKKCDILDAPVSGGEIGAINGNLSIMVGGNKKAFDKIKHILNCIGRHITYIGQSGSGQIAKACNQILVAGCITAVSEIFALARASKTNPILIQKALMGGFAYSKVLELHGTRIINNDFKPGFKTKLHLKDLNIALELSKEYGLNLDNAKSSRRILKKAVKEKLGEKDSSIMSKIVENNSK